LKGGELHNESRTQKGGELHNEFPPLKGGDRGGKKEGAGKEVRGEEKPPCKIFYHTLTDEQLKAEKLEWFSSTKFENLPFDRIFPDSKHNWLNLTDNDWDTLIPVCDRVSQETIFEFHSLGVSTNRDEWVFDISRENLEAKMRFFVESYNAQMEQAKGVTDWDKYEWGTTVKWSNTLKNYFMGRNSLSLINDLTKAIYYRPFVKLYYYAQKQLSDRLTQNHYDMFGQNFELDNLTLTIMGKDTPKPFSILMTNYLSCVNYLSPAAGTYLFPLYRYERDGSRVENVSEWALGLFRERYGISPIKVELEGVKKTTPNPSLKGGELHNESHTQKGGEHVARFPPFQGGIKGGEKWDRENLPREVSNLKHLKETRKELRSNATPAEATLWKSLQKNQLQGRKFRRQHSIGNYIADFYCSEEKLVIELDGAEHFTSQGSAYDAKRTEFMNQYGVRVLRFENKDVFESLDAVLKVIQDAFTIQKEDIFYYVYGVLHCPAYRTKYEQNLKRDFPRIPLYDDFWQWAGWGRQLADLHLNFETVAPYPLTRVEKEVKPKQNAMFADDKPLPKKPAIAKLKADKAKGEIILDTETTLTGIPADAWEYKLGNRSALEWILDQYKESTPTDPTIREKFNTYRFADYKEKVIDLLCRVCTVSVETMKIVKAMPRE
jgi:predicted helicase